MVATSSKGNGHPSKKRIKWILLMLVIFSSWAGTTVYKQWFEIRELKGKMTELKQEEQNVLMTKKELEDKVLMLQNNDYIAELARKYYFLSKPGEIIFISPEE